jgi:hypothetical protein
MEELLMIVLKIAGIKIRIASTNSFKINRRLKNFLSDSQDQADLMLSLISGSEIPISSDAHRLDDKLRWSNNNGHEDVITISIKEEETNNAVYQLTVNKHWNSAEITYKYNKSERITPFLGSLGEILFRNCILFHQGIVIHAATIEWEGRGIMFSAPSGTGKTTQANLWRRHKGAKMLNADRPAVRVMDGEAYVFGTLWNGSSSKYRNHGLPLAAIVLLEQAKENKIRKLDCSEATSRLLPRCFLPYYQKEIMNLALDNIEKLINLTPIYLLQCRPDREAVELVYQCIK